MGRFDGDGVREFRQIVREFGGTAREVRRGVDEVARTKGTFESFDPRSDAERDRAVVQAKRFEGQVIREDIRIMDLNDQLRARRGAYGEELPATPGALPPQGNGASWGYQAPVQSDSSTTRYAATGAAAAATAVAPPPAATSQAPARRVTVTEQLIESMSQPLGEAQAARTPAERDAAFDRYLEAVKRVGPNTDIVSIGGHLDFTKPNGQPFRVQLPPAGQTFRPGDLARPILQDNPELQQAFLDRVAFANGQAAQSQQPLAPQPPAPAGASQDQAGTKDASKGQNNPASTQTGTNQPDATASAPTTASQAPAAGATTAATVTAVPAATGSRARAYNERFPALPAAENQIMDIQRNLIAAGFEVGPTPGQADGKSGRRTWTAFETICVQAEPPIDPRAVDFRNPKDPETIRFNEVIAARIAQRNAQQQPAQTPKGPTPEELAAKAQAEAEARARAEQAQRLENDALTQEGKIPGDGALVLRGSAYDPRNLRDMPQADKRQLAIVGLHALDELKNDRGGRSNDTLHDKLAEAVRETNKKHGTNFTIPSESNPITDDALMAVGLLVAKRGGLSADVYRAAETQRQMDHAAAVGLHALDRTSGVIDVTSPDGQRRLRAEVKKFERDTELNVDGIADRDMLRALEQAVAVRGGLTKVGGGTDVQTQGGEPPAAPTAQPGQTDRAPDTRGK